MSQPSDRQPSALDRFMADPDPLPESPPSQPESEPDEMQHAPGVTDVRAMMQQRAQMDEVKAMQNAQQAGERENRRIAIAMQIVGMDVSKAMIGYNATAELIDQRDEDFLTLRALACDVLEGVLAREVQAAEGAT